MNRFKSPAAWAIILLGTAVLTLAGCGRKAGLDLPPNAPPLAAVQGDANAERAKPNVFDPSYGSDASPTASKGRKKPFILDPLLNSD